jgi:hypothetical protein
MFEFPPEIRQAIDTTEAIESVHSAIRTFTRNRKQYASADSAVKLIDLAISAAEVDDAERGLEASVEPLRHPLRGPNDLETQQVIWHTPVPAPDTRFPTGPILQPKETSR